MYNVILMSLSASIMCQSAQPQSLPANIAHQSYSDNKILNNSVKGFYNAKKNMLVGNRYGLSEQQQYAYNELDHFIQTKLLTDGSVYTNYLSINNSDLGDPVGHDVLSESAGLWLQHLAKTGSQQQFDDFYNQVKMRFYKNGQFSWIVKANGQMANTNATIDDVRIMVALRMAQQRFHDQKYIIELNQLLSTFKNQSLQNGLLVDYYDPTCKYPAPTIALNYLNIKDLGYLYYKAHVPESKLQQEAIILKNGYISNECPLYYENYNYQTGQYNNPTGQIDIIHSLMSIYNLSQLHAVKPQTLKFIKQAVATNTLYNDYDMSGKPTNTYQSAASYAIVALIAEQLNDQQLYNQAINRMLQFQVCNVNSPINGAIGDSSSLAVYSFNNLVALNALK